MEQNKITKQKTTRQQAVDRLLEQLPTMDRKALLKLWRDLFDGYQAGSAPRNADPDSRLPNSGTGFRRLKESTAASCVSLPKIASAMRNHSRVVCDRRPARDTCASITASCTRSPSSTPATSTRNDLPQPDRNCQGHHRLEVVRPSLLRSAPRQEGDCPMNRIRCAIYTRKSSEEGLEQAFNSLDAQREACEAYIRSQKHEGWQMIATHYDDGGYSGGNMDRPALKQLMDDIQAGKFRW